MSLLSILLLTCLSTNASELQNIPLGPDPIQTPGSKCKKGKTKYPERIIICRRKVGKSTKRKAIDVYEKTLKFVIYDNGRRNFKMDHLIPLCIGGSNNIDNLWPQHKSVYQITDIIEHETCRRVQRGEMAQQDAIDLVLTAKKDLESAEDILDLIYSI